MSQGLLNVSDADFEQEVLKAECVLVDFWAPWCGPCKMLTPILEEIAKDFEGKVKCVKVNVDDCPKAQSTYHVRGVPTLILYRNGELVATKVGLVSKADLTSFIQQGNKDNA